MIELPRPLEPWRAWLALLCPDLVEPLGTLLLQLHPLLGRLNPAANRDNGPPVGIGNIVRPVPAFADQRMGVCGRGA